MNFVYRMKIPLYKALKNPSDGQTLVIDQTTCDKCSDGGEEGDGDVG